MGVLRVFKKVFTKEQKVVIHENENSVIKRHIEFLIQQNNELGSRLQSLYSNLVECGDTDESFEINEEINYILSESERLTKRIQQLKELE